MLHGSADHGAIWGSDAVGQVEYATPGPSKADHWRSLNISEVVLAGRVSRLTTTAAKPKTWSGISHERDAYSNWEFR